MGERARRRFDEHFSAGRMVERTYDLYRSVLDGR
jgi:hypothetical protein